MLSPYVGIVTIHEIAEELEHVQSESLVQKLDDYLGNPKTDPHGDPIPNSKGKFIKSNSVLLSEFDAEGSGKFTAVKEHSVAFLSHLDKVGLALGDSIKVLSIAEFDNSYLLLIKDREEVTVSFKVASNILLMAD